MLYVNRKFGDLKEAIIIPISDSHIGDRAFDPVKLKAIVNDISKNENMYAVLIGDLINNATKTSKSDTYTQTMPPKEQKKEAINILSSIQSKILGSTGGNHEERTSRDSGVDLSEDIAEALKIPYDPYGVFYHVKLGKSRTGQQNYTLYTTHGSGGGGSFGSSANKVHTLRNIVLADVYVMGHVHKTIAFPDEYYVPDTRHSRFVKVTRRYCTAGSYLDWGGYAERLMLSPSPTGFPIIYLDGARKRTSITV